MLANIRCLILACEKLNISWDFVGNKPNFIHVDLNPPRYFINTVTPMNHSDVVKLCRDKGLLYDLLSKEQLIPETLSYLDPNCSPGYRQYVQHTSVYRITEDIQQRLGVPVIVKMNQGFGGRHVKICQKPEHIEAQLKQIYATNNRDYDYIALGQRYITISREWRAIMVGRKITLLYEKSINNATFTGNQSPLHWDGARAVPINDSVLISSMESFLKPLFAKLPLYFCGLDLVEDHEKRLWLLEANSAPSLKIFLEHNPDQEHTVVNLYIKALEMLRDGRCANQYPLRSLRNFLYPHF